MDIFVEKLVKKEKSIKDILFIVCSCIGIILVNILCVTLPGVIMFAPLVWMFSAFLVYYIISSKSIEYEYLLTNTELDIDEIIGKRKRKRVVSFSLKDVVLLAKESEKYFMEEKKNVKNIIRVTGKTNSEENYFVVINDNKKTKRIVVFEPGEKLLDVLGSKMGYNTYKK